MADSNIEVYESSQEEGMPIECYKFICGNVSYLYNSTERTIALTSGDAAGTYQAVYIKRSDINPNQKNGDNDADVEVGLDNSVAALYKGPPPEVPTKLYIYRLHEQDHTKYDIIFQGHVSQANFKDSICTLSVKMMTYLNKEIPNCTKGYTCKNVIYDDDCELIETNYQITATIDSGLKTGIYSSAFSAYPDGYFNNGIARYEGKVRQIYKHVGNYIEFKYPLTSVPAGTIKVAPGCDQLFKTCASKYSNTLNFKGFPYVSPTNAKRTAVGRGTYWVNDEVIVRDSDGFVGQIDL
jgi:uncharacterized phage protein (TIGR02218 family)